MTTGQQIRAVRLQMGWTQADLARAANIAPEYVSMLESDKRRPSPDLAATLSAVTNGAVGAADLVWPDGLPCGATLAPDPTTPSPCTLEQEERADDDIADAAALADPDDTDDTDATDATREPDCIAAAAAGR